MLWIGSALEEETLLFILILSKVPPVAEHSFAGDIFGKPELKHNGKDGKLCVEPFLKEFNKNFVEHQ